MNPALIVATMMFMNQTNKRRRESEDEANYQAIREEIMGDDDGISEDELNREADEIFLKRYGYSR
jgi:hypothetical protein